MDNNKDQINQQDQIKKQTASAESQSQANQSAASSGDTNNSNEESLEALEKQLLEKEEQIHEYIGRLQRLQADFENYRKRIAREQESFAKLIENRSFSKILPIFDSFDRAYRAFSTSQNKDSLAEGVKFIYSQFNDLLKTENIHPIEAVGKPFDPSCHEALMMIESDEPPNIILEEFERGFKRADQILRPSRVKVSKKRQPSAPAPEPKPQANEPKRGEQ